MNYRLVCERGRFRPSGIILDKFFSQDGERSMAVYVPATTEALATNSVEVVLNQVWGRG
jgi:hypothetical protein